METKVVNLATLEEQFYTCSPREAVIAAFAQSRGDWNTADYERKYSDKVTQGKYSVACGDFCVRTFHA